MTLQDLVDHVTVDLLPAEHGDCIFIRAAVESRGTFTDEVAASRGEFRILIDTGPGAASYEGLRKRLLALKPQALGARWIDLVVFTHLDADHIGNASRLLSDAELNIRFGDIWFNGYTQVGQAARTGEQSGEFGHIVKSFPQAESLSEVIEAKSLPLNRAFGGNPVVIPDGQDWLTVPLGNVAADWSDALPVLTLLAPNVGRLRRLSKDWDRFRSQFERSEDDSADGARLQDMMEQKAASAGGGDLDLDALARVPSGKDESSANGSSIAFVLEHRDRQLLFLGDAYAEDYEDAYARWREVHAPATRPHVVKLSHHGSLNNTTSRLASFGASHYLVSTNGNHFGHPNDAALARLVVDAPAGDKPKFWFNYSTPATRRWAKLAQTDARFKVHIPASDGEPGCGIVLGEFRDM